MGDIDMHDYEEQIDTEAEERIKRLEAEIKRLADYFYNEDSAEGQAGDLNNNSKQNIFCKCCGKALFVNMCQGHIHRVYVA